MYNKYRFSLTRERYCGNDILLIDGLQKLFEWGLMGMRQCGQVLSRMREIAVNAVVVDTSLAIERVRGPCMG